MNAPTVPRGLGPAGGKLSLSEKAGQQQLEGSYEQTRPR